MSNSLFRCILTLLLVFPCASAFGAASGDRGVTIQVSADGPVPSIAAARDLIRTRRAKGEWTNTPITLTHSTRETAAVLNVDSGGAKN